VTDEGLGGDTGLFLLLSKSSVQLVDVALGHTSRVHPKGSSARPSTISVTYGAMITRSSSAIKYTMLSRYSRAAVRRPSNRFAAICTPDAVPAARRYDYRGGRAQAYSVSCAGPNKNKRPVLTLDCWRKLTLRGKAVAALYENHQWAVTEDGIESIKPETIYPIEAHRLLERHGVGGGKFYDWPVHMAKKTWVDLEAFIEAFRTALRLHAGKYQGQVDPDILEASVSEARREAAKRAEPQMPVGEAQAPRYPEKEPPQYPEKKPPE